MSGGHFSHGQHESNCGPNEREAECIDSCNTCEVTICEEICRQGCACISGYKRDSFGNCIPAGQCRGRTSIQGRNSGLLGGLIRSTCPNDEKCITYCRRRNISYGICLGPRKEFCNCYSSVPEP
ncbi:TIL domain-containing protein [Nephila pilipes]|uniref:TIL domain-containing protein n=1 Tax=Nephila pilipes TaxID=299642 RepID=A0A8X6T224_NEPPI|nr:TIL domain-containing protein [Nephila pilipes]